MFQPNAREQFHMQDQMVYCLDNAMMPLIQEVSERQQAINLLRALRQISAETNYKDKAADIARSMNKEGIPLEATRNELTGETPLINRMQDCFRKAFDLLEARCQKDAKVTVTAEQAVRTACIELEQLATKPLYQESRNELQAALREFNAAVVIAKSNDVAITREQALEEVDKERGTGRVA